MSKGMTLFENGSKGVAIPKHLKDKMMEVNKRLKGGGDTYRRISLRGSRFRQIIDGDQRTVSKDNQMNVVIIAAAPLARNYFEGEYDPDSPAPPTCWSADTNVPHPDVPEEDRQSDRCATCPQNVKGSGQGKSRACRFNQRTVVAIEDDLDTLYQLQLPAASIFGKPENGRMPMNAYAKMLDENEVPLNCVVTELSFDEDAEAPKLFFKPLYPLGEEDIAHVFEISEGEEVKRLLDTPAAKLDDPEEEEEEAPPPRRKKAPAKAKAEEPEEEEEAPEPPKKRTRAKAKPKVAEKPEPVEEVDDDAEQGEDGEYSEEEIEGLLSDWGGAEEDEEEEEEA